MKEKEHLKPYMKPLENADRPEPCRKCKHRHMLRWLGNVPFCEHSCYTCLKRTKPCTKFERDYGTQLSLF
jgi:hypothetical protein